MDDNYDEVSDTYIDNVFNWFIFALICLVCFAVGGCVGHDFGRSTGREEMWQEAVKYDKAETLETSGGTFYRWKQ